MIHCDACDARGHACPCKWPKGLLRISLQTVQSTNLDDAGFVCCAAHFLEVLWCLCKDFTPLLQNSHKCCWIHGMWLLLPGCVCFWRFAGTIELKGLLLLGGNIGAEASDAPTSAALERFDLTLAPLAFVYSIVETNLRPCPLYAIILSCRAVVIFRSAASMVSSRLPSLQRRQFLCTQV